MITNNLILFLIAAFNIIFAFFLLKSIIPFFIYISSDYSVLSDKSYFKVKSDKGAFGEYLIFKKLEKLPFFKQMIINAYVSKNDNQNTEIDIIMICAKGIFVFESKNYSGTISGNEYDVKIKQNIKGNLIFRYNPIKQNENHIKHLKSYLKNINPDYFKSVIVFGDNSDITNFKCSGKGYILTKTSRLLQDIDFDSCEDVLSCNDINSIYSILLNNVFVSEKVKKKHSENVRQIQEKSRHYKNGKASG